MSRLTDEELAEAFEYAHGSLRLTAALAELRERRAADLSDEDRKALEYARSHLRNRGGTKNMAAVAALDRLLSHAGGDK